MFVDGQLKNAQLEQVADDAPLPAVLGRMYMNTNNAGAAPQVRGLTRWETFLTDNKPQAVKTASYLLTLKDQLIIFSAAAGSVVATLPAAAAASGKVFEIMRSDTVIANDVTVTPNTGAETIDGSTTFILKTKNDRIKIVSNGALWILIGHSYDEDWQTFTPGVANWVANTAVTGKYRRKGKCIDIDVQLALTGAPDALQCILGLPVGFQIDTTKMTNSVVGNQFFPGNVLVFDTSATERYHGWAAYLSADSLGLYKDDGDGTVSVINATAPMTFATGDTVCARISDIPIIKLR